MCGRFTYLYTWKQLHRLLSLSRLPEEELGARYNVAPQQMAPVVRVGKDGAREGVMLRWGLVPRWAKDLSISNRLINARAESVREKPAFREAFARRRCLVPVSAFYEWRAASGRGGKKQPLWIGPTDATPVYFAGLWERWGEGAEAVETFTIITTDSNELIAPLHDRMPVVIAADAVDAWLDPNTDAATLEAMLRPAAMPDWEVRPVSARLNSPGADDASLLTPDVAPAPPRPDPQGGLWAESP